MGASGETDRRAPLNIELDAETGTIRIERSTPLGTYVTVIDR